MIREFANLFELVAQELILAARRIERQSGVILQTRLRIRRWCRKIREVKKRIQNRGKRPATQPDHGPGLPCDWLAQYSKYSRIYWLCRYCERKTLYPATAAAQARAGERCAARNEAAR